jgi:GxxExxY protein
MEVTMPKQEKWLEEVTTAAEEVLNNLGDIQYTEAVYEEALCHELRIRRIPYERQRSFELMYKGYKVGTAICDFILNPFWAAKEKNEYVLELKAVKKIDKSHIRQAQVYMISLNIKNGAVLSFHSELGVLVESLEKSNVKPVDLKVFKPKKKKVTRADEKKLMNQIKKAVKEVYNYFGTEFIYREKTNQETYKKAIGVELRLKGIETKNAEYPILYKCQQVKTFSIPFIFADNSAMAFTFYKKPEEIEDYKEYYKYYAKQFGIKKLYLALIPQKEDVKFEFVEV